MLHIKQNISHWDSWLILSIATLVARVGWSGLDSVADLRPQAWATIWIWRGNVLKTPGVTPFKPQVESSWPIPSTLEFCLLPYLLTVVHIHFSEGSLKTPVLRYIDISAGLSEQKMLVALCPALCKACPVRAEVCGTLAAPWTWGGDNLRHMNCCCGFFSSIVSLRCCSHTLSGCATCPHHRRCIKHFSSHNVSTKRAYNLAGGGGGEGNVEEFTPRVCDRQRAWVEGMFLLSSRWFLARQFEAQHLSNIAKNSVFARRGCRGSLKVLVAPEYVDV